MTYFCTRLKAQMAESVDALVSNTSRATCAGSTPALGTNKVQKAVDTHPLLYFLLNSTAYFHFLREYLTFFL